MRHSYRSNVTGRWATKVDPAHDLVPVNVSATDVYVVSDNSLHGEYDAPNVADEPEAEPFHHRRVTQATGLRGAYDRALDQRDLVGEAQAGTGRLL